MVGLSALERLGGVDDERAAQNHLGQPETCTLDKTQRDDEQGKLWRALKTVGIHLPKLCCHHACDGPHTDHVTPETLYKKRT